jgi:hypothetical protein
MARSFDDGPRPYGFAPGDARRMVHFQDLDQADFASNPQ